MQGIETMENTGLWSAARKTDEGIINTTGSGFKGGTL
jgi:hypothetical protein